MFPCVRLPEDREAITQLRTVQVYGRFTALLGGSEHRPGTIPVVGTLAFAATEDLSLPHRLEVVFAPEAVLPGAQATLRFGLLRFHTASGEGVPASLCICRPTAARQLVGGLTNG